MTVADFERRWGCTVLSFIEGLRGVPDQGERGTCLAHAATAAHEAALAGPDALSAEYLYWSAKKRDPDPEAEGSTVGALFHGLEEDGQPEEHIWPYDPAADCRSADYGPPAGAYRRYRRRSRQEVRALDSVRTVLGDGGVAIVGFAITPDFITARLGLMDVAAPATLVLGHHAVAAVGRARLEEGEAGFLVRNSWGASWGLHGHGLMPEPYLERRLLGVWRLLDAP